MKRTKQVRVLVLAGAAFSLAAGASSCNFGGADICGNRFPEFDRKLEAAVAVLTPSIEGTRMPASDAGAEPVTAGAMDPRDRETWLRWAEERLIEAQHSMDAVENVGPTNFEIRHELSEIATAFVSFHGYATQGKVERMVRTLERIQGHAAKARSLACPGVRSADGPAATERAG